MDVTLPAFTPFEWLLIANSVLLVTVALLVLRSGSGRDRQVANVVRDALAGLREEWAGTGRSLREELRDGQQSAVQNTVSTLSGMASTQQASLAAFKEELAGLEKSLRDQQDSLRRAVEERLRELQQGNEKKLEEMRTTVDEKLQGTLEKRLGESFKVVSERLEAVHRGLGEMQELATGVGDLKRVLTNVKARGTWGEVQLEALLEQMLSPGQYQRNVKTKQGSNALVEFAIRLPGPESDAESVVWLPVDAKFPQEDYLRLVEAAEAGDRELVQQASDALVKAVKKSAQDIRDKYLDPPHTTDFAILFLPTEGLYSEVLRQPGVVEQLQQEFRVVVAGPTSLSAILTSLRVGFRTLAIEKRSAEVWQILGAVKTEFGKFGDVLGKLKKQLQTASNTVESAERRTRVMSRTLKEVESLPESGTAGVLEMVSPIDSEETEEEGESVD